MKPRLTTADIEAAWGMAIRERRRRLWIVVPLVLLVLVAMQSGQMLGRTFGWLAPVLALAMMVAMQAVATPFAPRSRRSPPNCFAPQRQRLLTPSNCSARQTAVIPTSDRLRTAVMARGEADRPKHVGRRIKPSPPCAPLTSRPPPTATPRRPPSRIIQIVARAPWNFLCAHVRAPGVWPAMYRPRERT